MLVWKPISISNINIKRRNNSHRKNHVKKIKIIWLKQIKTFSMPLFFSHSYIIPKLFCIKLFRLDLVLIRFSLTPCCCPTLCISQRCHHSELLNCALWWLEPAMPNMGQSWPLLIEASVQPSQPAPGHGHPAQWCRDSKEPEDSSRLAGDSSSEWFLQSWGKVHLWRLGSAMQAMMNFWSCWSSTTYTYCH